MAKFIFVFVLLVFIFINLSCAPNSSYIGSWKNHSPQEKAEARAKKEAKKKQVHYEMIKKLGEIEKKKQAANPYTNFWGSSTK
ncbi:unnamed protein product [Meloidogyne enterolobii]|uniref:Uncharacterized protein n=2 Tax=Meloidogyne enterolobii TaxID=390850 RepID=A0ACB1AUK8_MELEN|nr:unnamed protein product [Meloidogyne enterolobii]